MTHARIYLVVLSTASICVALVSCSGAVVGGATVTSSLESGDAEPQSTAVPEQAMNDDEMIEVLEENLATLEAQQLSERSNAEALLTLPNGAGWGPEESFAELEQQIESLEAGSGLPSGEKWPTTMWYEEGFFASLMALDWRCAWLSQAIHDYENGDANGGSDATRTLSSFKDHQLAFAFPDYDEFLSAYVEPLSVDDVSAATPYLANCPQETLVTSDQG